MNARANDQAWQTGRPQAERAFLVGVEFSSRQAGHGAVTRSSKSNQAASDNLPASHSRRQLTGKVPRSARAARSAVTDLHVEDQEYTGFSAEESMAELRELANSAGAAVIGEFQQRRPKPDPATLIGSGKA